MDGVGIELAGTGGFDGGTDPGRKRLMLVHGFTGGRVDFTEWFDAFEAAGWQAVAPDLRGHGASDHPDDPAAYNFDRFAADLRAVAGEIGWHRFTLLGHSMGGMIAQVFALRHPEQLEALVLMDTTHGPLAIDRSAVDQAIGLVKAKGMTGLLDALRALGDDPLTTPAHRRLLAERPGYAELGDSKLLASSPAMYEAMLQAMLNQDDRLAALGTLDLPTLVMVGEQDLPFLRPSERMAETIAGARLAVIPDAGHSPQFENPDAWWSALSEFLAAVVRSTTSPGTPPGQRPPG